MSSDRTLLSSLLSTLSIVVLMALALLLAACTPSDDDTIKGGEDPQLTDGTNTPDGTPDGDTTGGNDGTITTVDTRTEDPLAPEAEEDALAFTGSHITPGRDDAAAPVAQLMTRQAAGGYNNSFAPPPEPYPHPLPVTDRENYEDSEPGRFLLVNESPVSTFSADVDTASYANMRRMLEDGRLPQRGALRTEELVNYFSYDYSYPENREAPFEPTVWVTPTPWNDGTQLMHIGIRGFDDVEAEKPLLNLVFLIDVSGSMGSTDKLPLVQQSLRLLVNEMRPEDRISLVVYAGRSAVELEPTEARHRGRILRAIDRLTSGGSTAGAEGLRTAYQLAEENFEAARVNRVILASDGDFNVGISNPDAMRDFVTQKRETGIYLSVLGFGSGNYNDVMGQRLAQAGNGNASYIDSISEARKVLVDEMRATLFPIANDVKFQIEFNPAQVAEYRLVGYETRMLNREDFNNDEVDAGDMGAGHTVTAIYEIVPVGSDATHYEPLRYGEEATNAGSGEELAFLRMRYKLPGEDDSNLIERPIMADEALHSMDAASDDARFAAAVAAFGQHLRHDPYLPDYTMEDIIALAQSGRGDDDFGYRAEFVQLLRLAQSLEGGRPSKS